MRIYSKFAPTQFDYSPGYGSEHADWLVFLSHTRDSDALEESNYRTALECLENIDPDGKDHTEVRHGHWGPGWYELILVRPDTACALEAEKILDALSDYPVLDDEDHDRRMCEMKECRHTLCNMDSATWTIENGVVSIECHDEDDAQSVQEHVQSIGGSHVERDGRLVYTCISSGDDAFAAFVADGATEAQASDACTKVAERAEEELVDAGWRVRNLG